MSEAEDVLQSIDQLRRDLSGYHGQLKAHNDLAKHCENQRKRIGELEGLYAKAKSDRDETAMAFSKERDRAEFLMRENAELKEQTRWMAQTDSRWEAAIRDLEQAKAENSELRERVKGFLGQRDERLAAAETRCNELMDLVRDLMHCPVDLYQCETCEHAEVTPKSVTGNWDRYECKLKARAQELGVV